MEQIDLAVIYRGKEINGYQFLKRLKPSFAQYYLQLIECDMKNQAAFDFILHNYIESEKDLNLAFAMETDTIPAKEKIRKDYKNVKEFCLFYRIVYRSFFNILNKYPKANLLQVLTYYIRERNFFTNVSSYNVVYGVTLEAICVKFQLDYSFCRNNYKKGMNFLEVLQQGLAVSPIFPRKISLILREISSQISSYSFDDFRAFLENSNYSEEEKDYIIFYKYRYSKIQDALNVYSIVHFIEYEWEFLYRDEIRSLNQSHLNSVEFSIQYDYLKRNARKKLLEWMNLSEEDLKEYYQTFYCDYVPVTIGEESVWSYNRKRIFTDLDV